MAVLSGTISFRIGYNLQFRVFNIPWMKRRSTLRFCLNERDCSSSSLPVRYVPKRITKSDDQQKESSRSGCVEWRSFDKSLGGVRSFDLDTNDQNQKPPRTEISSFGSARKEIQEEYNYDFGMESCELMEEPEDLAGEMGYLQKKDVTEQNILVDKTMQDAEKSAIGLLATRAFTALELRKKLQRKRFPSDVVEALIGNFQHRGLINDGLYAETFSQSGWSSLSWGPRRIKQALYKKGVSIDDVEKALKLVFQDGDEDSKLGLSKLSMDHLLVQASKQWLRGQDASRETRKSRIVRWLQYRGFNWDVINVILRKLESQQPR